MATYELYSYPVILALKHELSDIAGMYKNFTLLVSHFQASIWALNRRRGEAHKPDRKVVLTFNTSQQYLIILLTWFRARMPVVRCENGRAVSGWRGGLEEIHDNEWMGPLCRRNMRARWGADGVPPPPRGAYSAGPGSDPTINQTAVTLARGEIVGVIPIKSIFRVNSCLLWK